MTNIDALERGIEILDELLESIICNFHPPYVSMTEIIDLRAMLDRWKFSSRMRKHEAFGTASDVQEFSEQPTSDMS